MTPIRRSLPLVLETILAVFAALRSVSADGSWFINVPRLDLYSKPAPVLDGARDDLYFYTDPIVYPVSISSTTARISAAATPTSFYVSVSGMPRKRGSVDPYVSVAFDNNHSGGSGPDRNDFAFNIDEAGRLWAERGDGTRFVKAPEITEWTAVRIIDETSWSVEFRISISIVGLGTPFAPLRIHIRHNSLDDGADYVWPPAADRNRPVTWGDVIWAIPGKFKDRSIKVDVYRITQGLDYDVTGGVAYDLVAGKNTLIRAQLFTYPGPAPELTFALCRFQRLSFTESTPVRSVVVSTTPTPKIGTLDFGFFNGNPYLDFWAAGSLLAEPGTYSFELEIGVVGSAARQVLALGTRSFFPAQADLRLLLFPMEAPPALGDYRRWDGTVKGSVLDGLLDYDRMLPLRSGLGDFLWEGGPRTPDTPGLRIHFLPTTHACPGSLVDPVKDEGACVAFAGSQADLAIKNFNAELEKKDSDGKKRDRFDYCILLEARQKAGYGNSWGGRVCLSHVDDAAGRLSGVIMAHETSHLLGEVRPKSPHSNPGDTAHSSTGFISYPLGLSLVDTVTRENRLKPWSLMRASLVPPASDWMHEGWEWNDLRKSHLTPVAGSFAPGQPLFHLMGAVDQQGNVEVSRSARIDDLDLELTPEDANGLYSLVFFNPNRSELARFSFTPSFEGPHGLPDLTVTTLSWITPLPRGSASIVVLKQDENRVVHSLVFSPRAPFVGAVVATPDPQIAGVHLRWQAADPDDQQVNLPLLSYNVYFQTSPNEAPVLVAAGLKESELFFATELAPASSEALLVVEASDGYNTGRAASNLFSIGRKPPMVGIRAPTEPSVLVRGQGTRLLGFAFDLNDGPLGGQSLVWTSDRDGFLGTGAELEVLLTEGNHVLRLEAVSGANLSAFAIAPVVVLADADGDGIPDAYEALHPCLSLPVFDADADPDGDGLTSFAEWRNGTDPCNPDTDGDGVSDADEVRLGSDPLDPQSLPLPDLLFLSETRMDLDACPAAPRQVPIDVAPGANWWVTSDSEWISAAASVGPGGGCITMSIDCAGLASGRYTGRLIVAVEGGRTRILDVNLALGQEPQGGLVRPGDCNQDDSIDISDGICLFGYLFLGNPTGLPCGDRTQNDAGNQTLLDHNGDSKIDLSDGIALLNYLFSSGAPPAGGTDCVRVPGCPETCAGR